MKTDNSKSKTRALLCAKLLHEPSVAKEMGITVRELHQARDELMKTGYVKIRQLGIFTLWEIYA